MDKNVYVIYYYIELFLVSRTLARGPVRDPTRMRKKSNAKRYGVVGICTMPVFTMIRRFACGNVEHYTSHGLNF
jgi:hypothetical protein